MRKLSRLRFQSGSLLVVSFLFSAACRSQQQDAGPPEYTPTATIKDIMDSIVDPSADVVWESVQTVVTASGIEERAPSTDEEWIRVRRGAIRLAEAPNLLVMPGRHVARPGEKSESPDVELAPETIEENIAKDRQTWRKLAKGLHDATLLALKAIDAKDGQALLTAGDELETACETCHSHYWYPNQKLPPGFRGRNR